MSEIEIITNGGRRRYWPAEEKVRIVEETLGGESRSSVARRNGVAPNLLYRWRRLMLEGEIIAVQSDDSVTANRTVRQLDARVRELERQLGRKTLEVEILKEALAFRAGASASRERTWARQDSRSRLRAGKL